MADKFEELRTWITIVEAGGVNAAAAKLTIAKSAVSRRLGELEARLGVTLVNRTTRRFELTVTGRTFYTESRRILADMDALERSLHGDADSGSRLVIATDGDLAADFLPDLVASFLGAEPSATIALNTAPGAEDDADVIVASRRLSGGRTLATFRRIVVASPVYLASSEALASPADLASHVGIAVTAARGGEWTFAAGVDTRPTTVLEVEDVAAARAAAVAGIGLAHLPGFAVAQAIKAGSLRPVLNGQPSPDCVIQAAAGNVRSAAADRLLDHLAKAAAAV